MGNPRAAPVDSLPLLSTMKLARMLIFTGTITMETKSTTEESEMEPRESKGHTQLTHGVSSVSRTLALNSSSMVKTSSSLSSPITAEPFTLAKTATESFEHTNFIVPITLEPYIKKFEVYIKIC